MNMHHTSVHSLVHDHPTHPAPALDNSADAHEKEQAFSGARA